MRARFTGEGVSQQDTVPATMLVSSHIAAASLLCLPTFIDNTIRQIHNLAPLVLTGTGSSAGFNRLKYALQEPWLWLGEPSMLLEVRVMKGLCLLRFVNLEIQHSSPLCHIWLAAGQPHRATISAVNFRMIPSS